MKVRIKFSADIYIDGDSVEEIRDRFEMMPLFTVEAQKCGVEYSETLLVEDAESYEDLSKEWEGWK